MEFAAAPEILALLFVAALVAGFIDTLAGGGGLITIPALLLANIPPVFALGTNKLQSSGGSMMASIMMLRKGLVDIKSIYKGFIASFLGSAAGAYAIQQIDMDNLRIIIPVLLVCIALYFLFSPQSHMEQRPPKISDATYNKTFAPLVGFYDGFLGPGTGSFFCATGILARGYDIIKATAVAKPLNFASNIGGLAVFMLGGKILWLVGAIMIAGQMIGAYLGAHVMVSKGKRLIRPLIVTVCCGMLIKYLMTL